MQTNTDTEHNGGEMLRINLSQLCYYVSSSPQRIVPFSDGYYESIFKFANIYKISIILAMNLPNNITNYYCNPITLIEILLIVIVFIPDDDEVADLFAKLCALEKPSFSKDAYNQHCCLIIEILKDYKIVFNKLMPTYSENDDYYNVFHESLLLAEYTFDMIKFPPYIRRRELTFDTCERCGNFNIQGTCWSLSASCIARQRLNKMLPISYQQNKHILCLVSLVRKGTINKLIAIYMLYTCYYLLREEDSVIFINISTIFDHLLIA